MVEPRLIDRLDRRLVGLASEIEAANLGADMPGQRDDVELRLGHHGHGALRAGLVPDPNMSTRCNKKGAGRKPALVRAALKAEQRCELGPQLGDRKSTRLNSSHQIISYAVF